MHQDARLCEGLPGLVWSPGGEQVLPIGEICQRQLIVAVRLLEEPCAFGETRFDIGGVGIWSGELGGCVGDAQLGKQPLSDADVRLRSQPTREGKSFNEIGPAT